MTRDPTVPTVPSVPQGELLHDTMLVAWLKLKGHNVIPWITHDDPNYREGEIAFEIVGDQGLIEQDTQAFYSNERVGIQDFNRCLKDVKSAMYNLKRLGKKPQPKEERL